MSTYIIMCVQNTRDNQQLQTVNVPSDVPLCSGRPNLWISESTKSHAESVFLRRAPVLYMTAVQWQFIFSNSIWVFSPVYCKSHLRAKILTPVMSPQLRPFCFASGCHPTLTYPILLDVLWHHVSFDFSNIRVVLDQYFQQFVSPVKLVSNVAQLKCVELNSGSKVWGKKIGWISML